MSGLTDSDCISIDYKQTGIVVYKHLVYTFLGSASTREVDCYLRFCLWSVAASLDAFIGFPEYNLRSRLICNHKLHYLGYL